MSQLRSRCLQGIFDLDIGKKIGKLVQQMQRQVDMLLPYKKGSTFLQTNLPALEEEPENEDESENEGQPDTNQQQSLKQTRQRNARSPFLTLLFLLRCNRQHSAHANGMHTQ